MLVILISYNMERERNTVSYNCNLNTKRFYNLVTTCSWARTQMRAVTSNPTLLLNATNGEREPMEVCLLSRFKVTRCVFIALSGRLCLLLWARDNSGFWLSKVLDSNWSTVYQKLKSRWCGSRLRSAQTTERIGRVVANCICPDVSTNNHECSCVFTLLAVEWTNVYTRLYTNVHFALCRIVLLYFVRCLNYEIIKLQCF
jgi:hypothetical protein